MLKFWAEDENGREIFSGDKEYGFDFKDKDGNSPAMEDAAVGRAFDYVLQPEKVTEEVFSFAPPPRSKKLQLKATLTYIFFVFPPPHMVDRMQKGIIKRIQEAPTQAEKDKMLNEEIPARMTSMNVLQSAYPPIVMAAKSMALTY